MSSLLEIKNLSKTFDNKKILDNVNLEIEKGRIVGLLGKNGAGKSTLIKLINDLLTVDEGGVILFKGKKLGVYSKEHISYLPERTYLDKSMKVSDVIKFFKDFYSNFDEKKAYALLKDLNLDSDIRISKMSKGMQEKLQLILVMSRDADLYILDEPHLISDIERILDDVVFIDKGKVVISSSADELRTKEKASIDDIFRREFKC